jgi:asparaginyl-tRNA synthetase
VIAAEATAVNAKMTVIAIEQAGKYDGQEVTLKGWLYNLRESGKLLFPIFRDGTGIIQGVCALKENPEAFESLKGLTQESSVIVTGKIRAEKRAPSGFEIGVTKIQIVQKVPESTPFPIQLKEHGVDFLLDQRHLWIRTPRQRFCEFARRPFARRASTWTVRDTR